MAVNHHPRVPPHSALLSIEQSEGRRFPGRMSKPVNGDSFTEPLPSPPHLDTRREAGPLGSCEGLRRFARSNSLRLNLTRFPPDSISPGDGL